MCARNVLIACFEVPGWGGASTAAYSLFERLQSDGMAVSMVNIIAEHDEAYFQYRFGEEIGNPRRLGDVYNCRLTGNNYRHHENLRRNQRRATATDVVR